MSELALGVLSFLDTPAPDFVRAAARAGFDSVSLRVGGSRVPVPADLSVDRTQIDETIAALAVTGVRVLDVEVLRLNDEPDLERRAKRAVALGRVLGARNLIAINQNLAPEACARALRRVSEIAEPAGISVVLEFMAFSATPDLAAAADVVRRAERENAAVLVDALHLARTGGTAADLAAHHDVLAPYVQVCGVPTRFPKRGLVHEATLARRLPGHGTGADQELLRAIPSDWAVSVEAPLRRDHRRTAEQRALRAHRAVA